jgi:hypothetical protein
MQSVEAARSTINGQNSPADIGPFDRKEKIRETPVALNDDATMSVPGGLAPD